MTAYACSYVFPFLIVMLGLQTGLGLSANRPLPWQRTALTALVALCIVVLPVKGLPLARWLVGLNANPSIPLMALLFSGVWKNATGKALTDQDAHRIAWFWGSLGGLVLYPAALGLGGNDPYALGFGSPWLFMALWMLTMVLLLKRNRFGVILTITILCYCFKLLESPNLWDYLIDPVFATISIIAMGRMVWRIIAFSFLEKRRSKLADHRGQTPKTPAPI